MLNQKEKEIIKILRKDGIGVMPTDTIYGLVGSAFSKKAVDRIFEIKKRDDHKPLIVLISSIKDLKKFYIHSHILLSEPIQNVLKNVWPGKVSVILPCDSDEFNYLHRGAKTIAFRLPAKKSVIEILKKTGPLVAPSANPQELKHAENIKQAKEYFDDNVDFYLSAGTLKSKSSTLIKIKEEGEVEVLRGILKKYGK